MNSTHALFDLGNLGKALKDAADAVKHLADAIAHIVRLGDTAWSEVSARRTHNRLILLYHGIYDLGVAQWKAKQIFSRVTPNTTEADWSYAKTQELRPLIVQVEEILSQLKAERGDFVLESAYKSLRQAIKARSMLFHDIEEMPLPKRPDEIAALQRAVAEWDRLHEELGRAVDSLGNYLKEDKIRKAAPPKKAAAPKRKAAAPKRPKK